MRRETEQETEQETERETEQKKLDKGRAGGLMLRACRFADAPEAKLDELRQCIGYPIVGVETRIVNLETDEVLPWDGKATGELEVSVLVNPMSAPCCG